MYCKYCGKELIDRTKFCTYCGKSLEEPEFSNEHYNQNQYNPDDSGSFGYALLGFLIPIVGLILFLIWNKEKPNNAKAAGKGALVCVIFSIVASSALICCYAGIIANGGI